MLKASTFAGELAAAVKVDTAAVAAADDDHAVDAAAVAADDDDHAADADAVDDAVDVGEGDEDEGGEAEAEAGDDKAIKRDPSEAID